MKGFSSKCIALKVDGIGAENTLFAGASVHFKAGVEKGLNCMCIFSVNSFWIKFGL